MITEMLLGRRDAAELRWDHREIVRQAKRDAKPETHAKGDRVAWTEHSYAGAMDGLSEIHRVYDAVITYCERELPIGVLLPFPPLSSLDTCLTCKERHASGWEIPVEEDDCNDSDSVRGVA